MCSTTHPASQQPHEPPCDCPPNGPSLTLEDPAPSVPPACEHMTGGGAGPPSLDPDERECGVHTDPNLTVQEQHEVCQTFRHGYWSRVRPRVLTALAEADPGAVERVSKCGSIAWVLRQPGDPPKYRLATNKCRCRWCQACADERRRSAAWKLEDHLKAEDRGTLRLLTLTLRSSRDTLAEQVDRLYDCFRRFRGRSKIKAAIAGGIAFLELTHSDKTQLWHPHLHVLFEGDFLPQALASTTWQECTGDSYIVDIRACKTRGAISYVAKYLGKAVPSKVWYQAALLVEAMIDLKGRKSHFTFGTWRGLRLSEQPEPEGDWEPVAPLSTIISRTQAGDLEASSILTAIRSPRNEPFDLGHDPPQDPALPDLQFRAPQ